MNLVRRRFVAGTLAAGSLAAGSLIARRPAGAVIVQDDTWRAEGGGPGREPMGFRAHVALANQPQFRALMAVADYQGQSWGYVSSTWIGNVQGRGRLLTSAHAFEADDTADVCVYRTPTGKVRRGTGLVIHPLWDSSDSDDRTGYDFAIVTLDAPVEDAGAPPLLYSGKHELGKRIVMIGFGRRGIGSVGQHEMYSTGSDKAAAENTVDEVVNAVGGRLSKGEDAGNWFGVTFHPMGKGGSRMDGILGSGDSGGSAWLSVGSGWAICGVNSSGGGAKYDDQSYFARVSGVAEWLAEVVPGVRFAA
jgi:hypothetical protein